MTDWLASNTRCPSDTHLLTAVSIPIAVAPFGYLLGTLVTVHHVSTETRAVWLSTVALTSITFAAYALCSDSGT